MLNFFSWIIKFYSFIFVAKTFLIYYVIFTQHCSVLLSFFYFFLYFVFLWNENIIQFFFMEKFSIYFSFLLLFFVLCWNHHLLYSHLCVAFAFVNNLVCYKHIKLHSMILLKNFYILYLTFLKMLWFVF